MARTIIVCGHGPGISDAVARKFGQEGFSVALVARNAQRLASAAAALSQAGVTAQAFPCDLSDPAAVRALVRDVRAALGPIAIVHWNAYSGGAGDLTTAPQGSWPRSWASASTASSPPCRRRCRTSGSRAARC